jgi:hypothetical protein
MLRRVVVLLVLLGCGLLTLLLITWGGPGGQSRTVGDPPVARVYNQFLYRSDLDHLATETTNPEERAELIDQYIQSWMTKQLMVAAAEARGKHKREDIDRKVLDYRYTLLVHSFIEELVNTQLNRVVSDEEIESYYRAHREDFVLRYNIFRGKFVVLPKDAPASTKLRTLLVAKTEAERAALTTYCLRFAKNYVLDETIWLPWEELMQDVPFRNVWDKAKLRSGGRFFQTSDDKYLYYFKIDDYRLAHGAAPLEFVSSQIADIIIYRRKIDLADKLKKDILQKAQQNNHCVVYEH